ncbi:DUF309 domain-containing protein [Alkalinema sp. FACHB-956]|uniref:DUF309 domain-containing protein n=1 Tax=Alkalinema sp. FACHB-956 TaxID=2692768 RepID=UPI001684E252|nr:DUF309 domain-containing protein [Alkalinema sp. FACHB-956]MBD2327202.1 DUF309 domain-containing protein [Alkalinema sp. FACHB-956]
MGDAFPAELWQGIEAFNQGHFYACHDILEAIWFQAEEEDKKFYQGILQIAVGLYHFGNGNWRGAVILMGEGLSRLQGYLPDYAGLDLEQLTQDAGDLLSTLQNLGADRVGDLVLLAPEDDAAIDPATTDKTLQEKVIRSRPIIQKVAPLGEE